MMIVEGGSVAGGCLRGAIRYRRAGGSVIRCKDAAAWDRFDPALPSFDALPRRDF